MHFDPIETTLIVHESFARLYVGIAEFAYHKQQWDDVIAMTDKSFPYLVEIKKIQPNYNAMEISKLFGSVYWLKHKATEEKLGKKVKRITMKSIDDIANNEI